MPYLSSACRPELVAKVSLNDRQEQFGRWQKGRRTQVEADEGLDQRSLEGILALTVAFRFALSLCSTLHGICVRCPHEATYAVAIRAG